MSVALAKYKAELRFETRESEVRESDNRQCIAEMREQAELGPTQSPFPRVLVDYLTHPRNYTEEKGAQVIQTCTGYEDPSCNTTKGAARGPPLLYAEPPSKRVS